MRWSDERYVKLYTRDTGEWSLVSWQAKGLFYELMRKSDAAGLIFLGRHGLKAVASLIRAPVEEIRSYLGELVEDGCVRLDGPYLVIPNLVAAQEAKASEKVRKAHEREISKAKVVLEARAQGQSAEPSENTQGPCHADNSLGHAVPTSPAQPNPAQPSPDLSLVTEADASGDGGSWGKVVDVWNRICVPAGFAKTRATAQQKKAATSRLREPGWFDAFEAACTYVAGEPFYRGGSSSGWVLTLGWLLKPGNSEKTADRAATRRAVPAGQRRAVGGVGDFTKPESNEF